MKKSKNILMVSTDIDLYNYCIGKKVSGDSFYRHNIYSTHLKNLTNKNSEITIIVYSTKNKFLKNTFKNNKNIKIIPSNSIHRFFFAFDVFKIFCKLSRNNWSPNLITTQNPWGEAFISLVFSKIFRCPFMCQIHTDILSIHWIKQNPILNFFRLIQSFIILNLSTCIRTVSKGITLKLIRVFKINRNKFKIIPVGITIKKENQQNIIKGKTIDSKNIIRILYVGRFSREKNLNLWLDTAFLVLKKYKKLEFILIGEGEEYSLIKKRIKKHKNNENFCLPGLTSYKELSKYYKESNILLLTSFYEGFGRVILEAMNFGIPCISTNSEGPKDLIKNKINGYIVNTKDPYKLSKYLIKLIEEEKLYSKMSKNCISIANEKYSFTKISKSYIQTMIDIMN